ncbi:MAG TPA: prephenate dehydratase [Dehalococcoidales bacterium]|nr:prephenate dehydratase [Dehalococcoidales bacterium]
MNIEELRKKIDTIDGRIVELFAERQAVSKEIGKGKKKTAKLIEDRERELRVLEHVRAIARGAKISPSDVENIYKQIITASKKIQAVSVAYQGEPGAYTEEAAFRFFGPSTRGLPRETLDGAFEAVQNGDAPFAMVPVENSLEGSINRAYDLLLDSPLMICGETELRISHCLIALEGATIDSIKYIYSHPQALGQSRNYLSHLKAELIPSSDTAGSVRMIRDEKKLDSAAVAGARAAELYGLKILAKEIEDNPHNFTRFFVLSKEDSPPSGNDKTSIVFSLKHKPGALYDCLREFAERKINLTKLESRPTRHQAWDYNFYVDFTGHREDKNIAGALKALEEHAVFVKILGSYPRAR